MANDLRLSAVVEDKFSAPLKKLQEQLTQVGGREHATRIGEQATAFKKAHEEVGKFGAQLKGVLAPALDAAGLSMLGIGGGLAGMVAGINNASTSLNGLRRLSATLQVPAQFIKDQEALFQRFGIGADEVDKFLQHAQDAFRDFKKGLGEFHAALADIDPKEAGRMMGMDTLPAAVQEYERYLNSIKDPTRRARMAALFLDDEAGREIGTVTRQQFDTIVKETQDGAARVTQADQDAAADWEKSWDKFKNSLETTRNTIAPPVMSAATFALQGFPYQPEEAKNAADIEKKASDAYKANGGEWGEIQQTAKGWWNRGKDWWNSSPAPPFTSAAQAVSKSMTSPSWGDMPAAGSFKNSLEAAPNDPSGFFIPPGDDSTSKEKQTGLQKTIQSTAILLSLRDVSIDAERRISEWWRKGIAAGISGALNPDTLESQAAAASLESVNNPGGYRSVYGPAGSPPPSSNNPAVRSPGGGGLTGAGAAGYRQVYEAAKAAGDPYPEVTAAQWANESGWGAHPSGKNNFFGQTAPGGGFVDYPTPEAGLADHLRRWTNFPDYQSAKTPEEALQAKIRHGYNQNAEYPGRVMAAMKAGEQSRKSVSAFAMPSGPGSLAPSDTQIVGGANLMSSGEFERKTGIHPTVGGDLVQVKTAGGHTFTVNKYGAANFKAFVEDLEGRGYKFNGDPQGYNPRSKFGGGGPSEHAYGNAIDINPGANPYTHDVNRPLQTDLPPDVSALAAKYGLSWGGDWRSVKDAMHFEYRGSPWTPNTAKTGAVDRAIGAQSFLQGGGMGANGVVHINLHGNLRDVNATTKIAGGLFKKVNLNRGETMPSATG
jgi:hypothetical protein